MLLQLETNALLRNKLNEKKIMHEKTHTHTRCFFEMVYVKGQWSEDRNNRISCVFNNMRQHPKGQPKGFKDRPKKEEARRKKKEKGALQLVLAHIVDAASWKLTQRSPFAFID